MTKTATESATEFLDEETREFLRCVLRSGLANADDLQNAVRVLLHDGLDFSPQEMGKGLVTAGVLSRWQANMLLRGKKRGFALGSYILRKPIGRGAMSVVYLAQHTIMKRWVALKILPPSEAEVPILVDRFKRESEIAAKFDHPNVVRVFEFGDLDDKLFMAMEYVNGRNLHEYVARDGRLPCEFALDVIAQAAHGLAHIHDMGIIHRDIKPTNLLLSNSGDVKVIDMGLAKMERNELMGLERNRLLGTADFVAPEQVFDSRKVDERADIYSLGCTLYFALTAQPPFSADTVARQLRQHQAGAVPDVRDLRPDCPVGISELLQRMLSKVKDDRPSSANDLLRQIELIKRNVSFSDSLESLRSTGDTVVE